MTKVFQNFDLYPFYLKLAHAACPSSDYRAIHQWLINDRFIALHMLLPVINGDSGFAVGGDEVSQRSWAQEKGMRNGEALDAILMAQIEDSGAEVFYNMDPLRFGSEIISSLPGCVKKAVAWRAAPSPNADFGRYDLVVCNFESILQSYRDRGWNAAWFYPAFDPVMDDYAQVSRATDVVFVGSYSRHHQKRADVVEAISELQSKYAIRIHLQLSRITKLAQTPLGFLPPLSRHRLPKRVAMVRAPAIFGRGLYDAFGTAKIVINGAIDMAGLDRGNMRCWEALGCGALMLSDAGRYPDGMVPHKTIATYSSTDDMVDQINHYLQNEDCRLKIAQAGTEMLKTRYSKSRQWSDFLALL